MNDLVTWVLGGLSALLMGIGGFVFKQIFDKLKELETRQSSHENKVQKQFAELHKELAINSERDNAHYESTMMVLHNLKEGQDEMLKEMGIWRKNIENFYYLNPELKKPDV